jgi:hypothetical protein
MDLTVLHNSEGNILMYVIIKVILLLLTHLQNQRNHLETNVL